MGGSDSDSQRTRIVRETAVIRYHSPPNGSSSSLRLSSVGVGVGERSTRKLGSVGMTANKSSSEAGRSLPHIVPVVADVVVGVAVGVAKAAGDVAAPRLGSAFSAFIRLAGLAASAGVGVARTPGVKPASDEFRSDSIPDWLLS